MKLIATRFLGFAYLVINYADRNRPEISSTPASFNRKILTTTVVNGGAEDGDDGEGSGTAWNEERKGYEKESEKG